MERVFEGGPWLFDNYMLTLVKVQPGYEVMAIPLDHVDMWVQIFNLPFGFIIEMVGKNMGNYIGEFLEHDEKKNDGPWRAYMRVSVRIDINKPLKKERRVMKAWGDCVIASFKYERLGLLCFLCGMVGHSDQLCGKIFELEEDTGERQWSNFSKADQRCQVGGGANRWLWEEGGGARKPITENPNSYGTGSNIPKNQEVDAGDNIRNNSSVNTGEQGALQNNSVMVCEYLSVAANLGAITVANNYRIGAITPGTRESGASVMHFNAIQGNLLAGSRAETEPNFEDNVEQGERKRRRALLDMLVHGGSSHNGQSDFSDNNSNIENFFNDWA